MAPHLLLVFILMSLTLSCTQTAKYRLCQGATWGTTFHITYQSDRNLDDSIIAQMRRIELSLSPFCDTSTVSRINRNISAATDPMFQYVFNASQEISHKSGGAFDPTLAPLINLWGFGYRDYDTVPTQAQVDSALLLVGINSCSISRDGKIIKKHPYTEFNFSAIAKGYGADVIADMFKRNDCNNFLIEIGGEINASGVNPRRCSWNILVDAPINNDTTVSHSQLAVISATDCGIATSGNYRNFLRNSDGTIGHTIDRLTGRPTTTSTLSVTVISSSTMRADAFATACMAMNLDSAMAMIEREQSTEALFVVADSTQAHNWHIISTSGFPPIDN